MPHLAGPEAVDETQPGCRIRPADVTVCLEPCAISRRMCASWAQSPVFHHSSPRNPDRAGTDPPSPGLARSVRNPTAQAGRHRSIASSTLGPVCLDSMSSCPPLHSARLSTIRPAACGRGGTEHLLGTLRSRQPQPVPDRGEQAAVRVHDRLGQAGRCRRMRDRHRVGGVIPVRGRSGCPDHRGQDPRRRQAAGWRCRMRTIARRAPRR